MATILQLYKFLGFLNILNDSLCLCVTFQNHFMKITLNRTNLALVALASCVILSVSICWSSYSRYSALIPFNPETYCHGAACENAEHYVDIFKNNKNSVYVTGWVLVKDKGNLLFNHKFIIYNVASGKYYSTNIKCIKRPDVTSLYDGGRGLTNYDNSGFTASLQKDRRKLAGVNKFYIAYDNAALQCLVDLNLTVDIQ